LFRLLASVQILFCSFCNARRPVFPGGRSLVRLISELFSVASQSLPAELTRV